MSLKFSKSPDLTFEVGGKSFDPNKVEYKTPYDVSPFVVDSNVDKATFKIPVKVTFKGQSATSALTYSNVNDPPSAATSLRKVTSGAVKLPGDDSAVRVKGALLVHPQDVEVVGDKPVKSNAEIDIIGVADNVNQREGTCGVYEGDTTRKEIKSLRFDTQVVVYERRTGKELGKQVFPGPPVVCPSKATIGTYFVSTYGDLDAQRAFLKTFVK